MGGLPVTPEERARIAGLLRADNLATYRATAARLNRRYAEVRAGR